MKFGKMVHAREAVRMGVLVLIAWWMPGKAVKAGPGGDAGVSRARTGRRREGQTPFQAARANSARVGSMSRGCGGQGARLARRWPRRSPGQCLAEGQSPGRPACSRSHSVETTCSHSRPRAAWHAGMPWERRRRGKATRFPSSAIPATLLAFVLALDVHLHLPAPLGVLLVRRRIASGQDDDVERRSTDCGRRCCWSGTLGAVRPGQPGRAKVAGKPACCQCLFVRSVRQTQVSPCASRQKRRSADAPALQTFSRQTRPCKPCSRRRDQGRRPGQTSASQAVKVSSASSPISSSQGDAARTRQVDSPRDVLGADRARRLVRAGRYGVCGSGCRGGTAAGVGAAADAGGPCREASAACWR